jgi:sugar/nucleoside kinase (ribokinase family)
LGGKFDVIRLGMSCVDCILKVESVENLNRVSILDWTIQGGGKASTAMVAAARLGAKNLRDNEDWAG